jgi:hypothetical protein
MRKISRIETKIQGIASAKTQPQQEKALIETGLKELFGKN